MGLDLGFGYDFGSTRIEGTWSRGQSPGGTDRGTVFVTDTTINSLLLSAFMILDLQNNGVLLLVFL